MINGDCDKYILFSTLLFHVSYVLSFELYSKSVYWTWGANIPNIDVSFPFDSSVVGDPGSRDGAASWVDSTGSIWIFGGYSWTATCYLNDLWKLEGDQWAFVGGTGAANSPGTYSAGYNKFGMPSNRENAAHWVDSQGLFWLYGGYGVISRTAGMAPLNDLWYYNITNNKWTWVSGDPPTLAPNRTEVPAPRSEMNFWSYNDQLFVFGGLLRDQNATNDLWRFDIATRNWTLISAGRPGLYAETGGYPPQRAGAAIWVDANKDVWMFGGQTSINHYLSDQWKYLYSTRAWTWVGGGSQDSTGIYPAILGTPGIPAARKGACSWYDADGYLWLYGGQRTDPNSATYFGDFWKLQISGSPVWNWAGTSAGGPEFPESYNITGTPGKRSSAVCWVDHINNMWVYGGVSSEGAWDDVWVIDMNECLVNNGGCFTNCTNNIGAPSSCRPCGPGLIGDGTKNCTDINECLRDNGGCDPLTNCTNTEGSPPICSPCPKGYNGTGETGCYDFDECSVNNGGCDPIVQCTSGILDAPVTCGPCPPGFNGTGYTRCDDIDECKILHGGCDLKVNCTNNRGAPPTCGPCPSGYEGDGRNCTDIDECLLKDACDPLVSCINNLGAPPTCGPCPPFYKGDGKTGCVDIDECALDNGGCTPQSVCVNNVGALPTCSPCANGFIGNNWCNERNSTGASAAMIAGVTIGGFVVLLILIGMIFHFSKDQLVPKSPSSVHLHSPNRFELSSSLSQS